MPAYSTNPPTTQTLALYHPDPVIRLIGCMSDDLLPSMREVSAETLARTAKERPEVVEAMIRTVQSDPAPSVRVCCCRCLVEMQVRSPECVAALKALEDDREQTVRTAAAAALSLLEQP
jgi:HEAT repeat protein